MQRTFVFDLDGSLIETQPLYDESRQRFASWVRSVLGDVAPAEEIITRLDERIYESIEEDGFYAEQFPEAMQEVYKDLAWRGEERPQEAHLEKAYEIGSVVAGTEDFYAERGLLPGAEEALDYLQERGDELVLLTKGDPRVQARKIAGTDLDRWFDEAYITDTKEEDVYRRVAAERDTDRTWVIDDSARHIRTVLEEGLGAIYKPEETWSYEETELPEDDSRLFVIEELTELINLRETFL